MVQHIVLAFEARRAGQLGDIGSLEKGVGEFVSRTLPQVVWKESDPVGSSSLPGRGGDKGIGGLVVARTRRGLTRPYRGTWKLPLSPPFCLTV